MPLCVRNDADRNVPVPMQIGAIHGTRKGSGKGIQGVRRALALCVLGLSLCVSGIEGSESLSCGEGWAKTVINILKFGPLLIKMPPAIKSEKHNRFLSHCTPTHKTPTPCTTTSCFSEPKCFQAFCVRSGPLRTGTVRR